MITNAETFQIFLERLKEPDILKWALSQRPNSDWVVELVTNATIFVNRILQHPIRCVGIVLPPHVKRNMSILGLDKDYHSIPYVDNLCLFRCLGMHQGHDPKTLYAKYNDQPVETFEGVTVDELNKAETMFEVNVIYIYNKNYVCLYVCLSVCVCLSSIGGQTAGPIMTKFGTHMRIDLGMVPTNNWPHEWPGSVGSLGPISESGLSCQLLLRAVVWQMTSQ